MKFFLFFGTLAKHMISVSRREEKEIMPNNIFSKLYSPFTINRLEIKNRIVMAPMLPNGRLDADKNLTDETIAYYEERAKGGAGLIIVGASFPDDGLEITDFAKSPGAAPNTFLFQTRKLVESVHRYGCKLFFQIQLGSGRTAVPEYYATQPIAPSPVKDRYNPEVMCRELTTEEVYKLIDAVVSLTALSQAAGCDGVNINGVKGGYLGDQFAIEAFNHRTDEFGGDIDGRIRVMTKIIEGIRAACGPDFPVTTRIGTKSHMKAERVGHLPGEEYTEFGRDMEESLIIAKKLEEAGYDGVVFGTGSYDSIYWLYPPMYMPDGCYIEEASKLAEVLDIPVIVPGKLSDPVMAEKAIEEGKIDALAMGRQFVADPYWPVKVKEGKLDEIRPCLYCNNGCLARVLGGMPMACAVNPDVFGERLQAAKYAKVQAAKKIAVIGGGVAGMEAARVAAMRGHDVTIYEKEDHLGGLMIPGEVPEFKKNDRALLAWYKKQLAEYGVTIKLNTPVDAESVKKLPCDSIVVSTGSKPRKLPVPGGDLAVTAADVLTGVKKAEGKVVIIGGGQVGVETALWLKDQGYDVSIVEAKDNLIAATAEPIAQPNRDMLLELLIYKKIPAYTGAAVKEVKENAVICEKDGSTVELPCDTAIVSIGYVADDELYRKIDSVTSKQIWLIGDAKQPGTIMSSIRDASAVAAIL